MRERHKTVASSKAMSPAYGVTKSEPALGPPVPRSGRGRAMPGAAVLIALLATLAFSVAPARASYDPLASGTTRLSLDKRFLSFLNKHGVKLQAKRPAKRRGKTIVIPVSAGKIDPTIGKGTIEGGGVLIFKRGRFSLPFKRLTVKTKSSPLQAKVGGNQLKVAEGARISAARAGFDLRFAARAMKLTAKLATRLGKKLHLGKAFSQGQTIGSLKSVAQPQTVAILPQGRATLVMDPALVAKLDSLFVSLNPIFPAELSPGPAFSFPIAAGGHLAPDASQGTLRTSGSIEALQQGAGQVFLDALWYELSSRTALAELDVEPTPPFSGKLGQVPALAIGPYAVSSDPKARTISVSGAPLALSAQIAASFNEAFAAGKATFYAGEPFGTVSFTARGQ